MQKEKFFRGYKYSGRYFNFLQALKIIRYHVRTWKIQPKIFKEPFEKKAFHFFFPEV
jgi:hypothetical protein